MGKFHLTPEIIEAAYELLRVTPPFSRWKLPPADEIIFHATKLHGIYADQNHMDDGPGRGTKRTDFRIRISISDCATLPNLLPVLAHEMIHLHEGICGVRNDVGHGREFKKRAARVARYHDFGSHPLWLRDKSR